ARAPPSGLCARILCTFGLDRSRRLLFSAPFGLRGTLVVDDGHRLELLCLLLGRGLLDGFLGLDLRRRLVRELLVRRDAAVLRARQRRVRAALAVRED